METEEEIELNYCTLYNRIHTTHGMHQNLCS